MIKPIIVKSNIIPAMCSIFIPVAAITLWPFIFVRKEHANNKILLNHETIHCQQYLELWIIGMWFIYIFDWIHGIIKYRNPRKAYFRIRVEQEAYYWQRNLLYPDNRIKYAWRTFYKV